MRDRRHAVEVAVQQVAGIDGQPANSDRHVDVDDVAIAMRRDRSVSEGGKTKPLDLCEVSPRSGRDEALRPESLVRRTHHFAERGRGARFIEVVKNQHRRTGDCREGIELCADAAVGIAASRRSHAAEGGSQRIANHRWKRRKARLDRRVHVAGVAWSQVPQLDSVADRGGIELTEFGELFGQETNNRHDGPFKAKVNGMRRATHCVVAASRRIIGGALQKLKRALEYSLSRGSQ